MQTTVSAAPNIQQLAEQGWIHLDNVERVALAPFARLDDWQRGAERLAVLTQTKELLCRSLAAYDMGSHIFGAIMEVLTEQQREAAGAMELAAAGKVSEQQMDDAMAARLVDVEPAFVPTRRPRKERAE